MIRSPAISVCVLWVLAMACAPAIDEKPCTSRNGACLEFSPSASVQMKLQEALIKAKPGDVIFLRAGTYKMTAQLSIEEVDDLTIRGEGPDKTILSFKGQTQGSEGIHASATDNFVIEDLAVEDTKGDAIKVEGSVGVTFRRVRTEWTDGPKPTNGSYGLYPVQCTNVVVDASVAIGASDAGIYVGQSRNIIVKNSRAEFNVAGIEIENSHNAEVRDNVATNNTGGILVFSLPGLQVPDARSVRVLRNKVYANNTPNFAPAGNIVGQVPTGTGMMVMAATDVEFFDNEIRDNNTVNFAIVSYLVTQIKITDPSYYPYPERIHIHNNKFAGGGAKAGGVLGLLVAGLFPQEPIPDIIWDGIVNPAHGTALPDDLRICLHDNIDANFASLGMDADLNFNVTRDQLPHQCSHPSVANVKIGDDD